MPPTQVRLISMTVQLPAPYHRRLAWLYEHNHGRVVLDSTSAGVPHAPGADRLPLWSIKVEADTAKGVEGLLITGRCGLRLHAPYG